MIQKIILTLLASTFLNFYLNADEWNERERCSAICNYHFCFMKNCQKTWSSDHEIEENESYYWYMQGYMDACQCIIYDIKYND